MKPSQLQTLILRGEDPRPKEFNNMSFAGDEERGSVSSRFLIMTGDVTIEKVWLHVGGEALIYFAGWGPRGLYFSVRTVEDATAIALGFLGIAALEGRDQPDK